MTVDAVYIVGGVPDEEGREELRYSLRSIHKNLRMTIRDLWIVGDVPDWFTGMKMPLEPKPDKWRNQRASLEAYVNHPNAAAEFILLNDDHYLIEPVEVIEPVRNKKPASNWAAGHGLHDWSCWTCAVKQCAAWVSGQVVDDVYLYENHTPLQFNTERLRAALLACPDDVPFMAGAVFALAGIGYPGTTGGNAKVKANDALADKLALPIPYISGNPDSWRGELGAHIKGMFPDPCRWEV